MIAIRSFLSRMSSPSPRPGTGTVIAHPTVHLPQSAGATTERLRAAIEHDILKAARRAQALRG